MSPVVSIHTSPAERVAAKLREQATAQNQIATILTASKPTIEAQVFATEHAETARLFTLLHTLVIGGLLDKTGDKTGPATRT